jgi:isocitrate/isopropylmalate dehydrogenase
MKKYQIAVIPGDGTGPEVVREGLKVLQATSKKYNFSYETTFFPFGGEHIKRPMKLYLLQILKNSKSMMLFTWVLLVILT